MPQTNMSTLITTVNKDYANGSSIMQSAFLSTNSKVQIRREYFKGNNDETDITFRLFSKNNTTK